MPALPKPAALRQRRNKAATHASLSTEERPRQRAPRLPKREGKRWNSLTRAWWRDVWASPMAPEYLRSDLHGLYLLAELVDTFWGAPSTALASEIRLQRQCFGLTPIDRRRLQWEVERAEMATTRKQQRIVREAHETGDPRDALRAVK